MTAGSLCTGQTECAATFRSNLNASAALEKILTRMLTILDMEKQNERK